VDDIQFYAERQRATYETHATSREKAEAMVGPGYEQISQEARVQAQFIMNEYIRRQPYSDSLNLNVDILDFGCGVGRVMEAFVELGFCNIDGVDISEKMISYARMSDKLPKTSRFWLTSGNDCGDAPADSYDFVYSLITMHHICLRQTRIDIFRSMQRCLRPGGVIALEFMAYPGATAARVPHNHATWSMNMTAEETNSRADVWITGDQLGQVYDDFRLFFRDVAFQEIDLAGNYFTYFPDEIYQYPNTRFLVTASKGASMALKYFGSDKHRSL
jgi:2-polyprenyl-3-methyl-5-hydroxy-6-metoxy-1,4-benzoquinol methylase